MSDVSPHLNSLGQAAASLYARLRAADLKPYLPFILLFILTVAVRLPFMNVTFDDAYITFRYARNLAAGLGFAYNAGEPVLGTTTPLYTLVLTAAARLGLDLVTVGKLLNITADGGTAIILFMLLNGTSGRSYAWAGALFFILSSNNLLYAAGGMETGLYVFLLIVTMVLASRGRTYSAAVVAAALVLVRPDGLLAVGALLAFWLLQRKPLLEIGKAIVLFAVLTAPWALFATWYFGSPIPHSITAKALSYRVPSIFDWGGGFLERLSEGSVLGAVVVILMFLIGCGSVLWIASRRRLLVFVIWFGLYVAAFSLARASSHTWYFSPLMPILILFCCMGTDQIFAWIRRVPRMRQAFDRIPPLISTGGMLAVGLVILVLSLFRTWELAQEELSYQNSLVVPISNWLLENGTSQSTVCLESIGAIGWYTNQIILDEGGLVTDRTRKVNEQTPGIINPVGILKAYQPNFYVAWSSWELDLLDAEPTVRSWFEQNYEEMSRFRDPAHGFEWVLFRRRSSASQPDEGYTGHNAIFGSGL